MFSIGFPFSQAGRRSGPADIFQQLWREADEFDQVVRSEADPFFAPFFEEFESMLAASSSLERMFAGMGVSGRERSPKPARANPVSDKTRRPPTIQEINPLLYCLKENLVDVIAQNLPKLQYYAFRRLEDGNTELHFARGEAMKLLLKVPAFLAHLNEPNTAGQRPIDIALELDDVTALKALIRARCQAGADLAFRAASLGSAKCLAVILKKFPRFSLKNRELQTPLHFAASHRCAEVIVDSGVVDPYAIDIHGELALHAAARSGHTDVFEYLLEKMPSGCYHPNSIGDTPLHVAAREGRVDVVRAIVKQVEADAAMSRRRVDASGAAFPDSAGVGSTIQALLQMAFFIDKERTFTSTLDARGVGRSGIMLLNAINQGGKTALSLAIENRHAKVATALLAAGVDTVATDRFLLFKAIAAGLPSVLAALVSDPRGREAVDMATPDDRRTPLHVAAAHPVVGYECVDILLKAGANPRAVDSEGLVPADYAANEAIRTRLQLAAAALVAMETDASMKQLSNQQPQWVGLIDKHIELRGESAGSVVAMATPGEHYGGAVACLDGSGGVRGALGQLAVISHVCRMTSAMPEQLFDAVCGSSAGGIVALLLGARVDMATIQRTLFDIAYEVLGGEHVGGGRRGNRPPYSLAALRRVIGRNLGETAEMKLSTLTSPPAAFAIAADISSGAPQPMIFHTGAFRAIASGANINELGVAMATDDVTLVDACVAVGVLPMHFHSCRFGTLHRLTDGAIVMSNPAQLALALIDKESAGQRLLLSLGSGVGPTRSPVDTGLGALAPLLAAIGAGGIDETIDELAKRGWLEVAVGMLLNARTTGAEGAFASRWTADRGCSYVRLDPLAHCAYDPTAIKEADPDKLMMSRLEVDSFLYKLDALASVIRHVWGIGAVPVERAV